MNVKSSGLFDFQALHKSKARAIGKAEILVAVFTENSNNSGQVKYTLLQ